MTVKELIEKLKVYPDATSVIVWIEAEVLEDFEYPILGVCRPTEDTESVGILV